MNARSIPFLAMAAAMVAAPASAQEQAAAKPLSYYPPIALNAGVNGRVSLSCTATSKVQLKDCRAVEEAPAGQGFGEAALKLSTTFQRSSQTVDGEPVDGGAVSIPITFGR